MLLVILMMRIIFRIRKMKNVLKPLAKSVLISLGLNAAVSTTDAFIHKEMLGSRMRKFIILNDLMK